ncbi:hypothetical protein [Streptomyces sp. HPF1205]|uniref:hypothetical protein n=1 Tax=Streptomyces sp. HPF1205 TaxID=2873262 RepID=UPI0035ABBB8C
MSSMVAQEVPTSTTMALPHGPTGVAEARRRLRTDLYARDVPEPVVDDAVLILSELLSNSCRHARPLGDRGWAGGRPGGSGEGGGTVQAAGAQAPARRLSRRMTGGTGAGADTGAIAGAGSAAGVDMGLDTGANTGLDTGADAGALADTGARAERSGRTDRRARLVAGTDMGTGTRLGVGGDAGGARLIPDQAPAPALDPAPGEDPEPAAGGIRASWSVGADGLLVLEVTDGGGPTRPRPASPSLTAHGGRGLGIVSALAQRWGVRDAPGEVTVWVVLPVRGRHARRDDPPTGIGLPRGVPLELPLDLAESLDDLS